MGNFTHWYEVAEVLREEPGRWHLVSVKESHELALVTASHIRRANYRPFYPVGAYDTYTENCEVYARYDPSWDELRREERAKRVLEARGGLALPLIGSYPGDLEDEFEELREGAAK